MPRTIDPFQYDPDKEPQEIPTREAEKAIQERADKLMEGVDLVLERVFKVGIANSRAGVPTAMPAQEERWLIPKPESCEEIPATAIDKGDRLITVPSRRSRLGRFITVQEIEVHKIEGIPANVQVLAMSEVGLPVRMNMDPGTLVRRF